MRLLDLVKEDNCVGRLSQLFCQLAALVVADVAGRRPDKFGHFVLLLILRHVHANETFLGVVFVKIFCDLWEDDNVIQVTLYQTLETISN